MTTQRTLDEYLARLGATKPSKPVRLESFTAGTGSARTLALCLKPSPHPRTVIVCGSLDNARGKWRNDPGGYAELSIDRVANMLCKGVYPSASTIVFRLGSECFNDKWRRLLVFWTIRSLPQRFRVVLVLPELAKLVEEFGGEDVLPLKPPRRWSWLITLISKRVGECWEAFI